MPSLPSARTTTGSSSFELDRFELVEGQRYEVEGRWSGVRGRVFIRPELTVSDGARSRRLLADLAQKPWQPRDGDIWAVAFPCAGQPIDAVEAELTVAPGITVAVKRGSRARRPRAGEKRGPNPNTPSARSRQPHAEPRAEAGRRRGLGVQLAEARAELERAGAEHSRLSDRLEAATRRAEAAQAERDRATQFAQELTTARDEALRTRDSARAERDLAIREATVDREAARLARDEAIEALDLARGELRRALDKLEVTATERDSAIRAGVEVERELRAATAQRDVLRDQYQQLVTSQTELQSELDRLTPRSGEPRSGEPLRQALSPHQPSPIFTWSDGPDPQRSGRSLLSRTLALVALAAAAAVIVLVLVSQVL